MKERLKDLLFGLLLSLFVLPAVLAYLACAAIAGCFLDKRSENKEKHRGYGTVSAPDQGG